MEVVLGWHMPWRWIYGLSAWKVQNMRREHGTLRESPPPHLVWKTRLLLVHPPDPPMASTPCMDSDWLSERKRPASRTVPPKEAAGACYPSKRWHVTMQQSIHQLKVTIDFSSLAEPLPFGGSTVLSLNSYTTSASPIGCHYANEVCFFSVERLMALARSFINPESQLHFANSPN